MSFYMPPWTQDLEPNQTNIRQWLDSLYSKYQPIEQARWSQSNIDTLFYSGSQEYVNRHFQFSPGTSSKQFYFNIIQQPVNMVTGYQRQHRKSIIYSPTEGGDSQTTDQYTRLMMHAANKGGVHEQFSRACELAAVSGMVLVQPFLDFQGDDPAQGELKLKVWEYNSFLVDPYFRMPDMSDAQYFWFQEYISKNEAEERFPDQLNKIRPMAGSPQRYGSFYFLPENYNMARNDLMVLSYVWYKWRHKKKMLYSKSNNQFYEFSEKHADLEQLLYNIPDMEVVEKDAPCWKVAVVLNDQLMFQGANPMGFDACPVVPIFWNYDPQVNYYDLRVRSLVRTMRDPQYLFNRRVIINHDITEATINAGWKRKVGAVANEDNLKRSGQGFDVIVNEGYDMSDVEKILPSGVPESDMALAEQMLSLVYTTSGVNVENWSAQEDKNASGLTTLLKQGANLMVLQKYFDQWDYALKLVGERMLDIVLHNWNAQKCALYIGEEPSPYFFSGVFAKYKTLVEEGLNTATQRNMQAQQLLDINAAFGREVFPPSMIVKDMNLSGRDEAVKFLAEQEQGAQAQQQHAQMVASAIEDAKVHELHSKAVSNIATARERHGRSEANVGLFEERLSEISHNRSLALKEKMDALEKLLGIMSAYGELETLLGTHQLNNMQLDQEVSEDREKADAKRTSLSNEFVSQMLGGVA